MKKAHRIISLLLVTVLVLGLVPVVFTASAGAATVSEQAEKKTVYYTVPAIFVNVGDTVTLDEYDVMFDPSNATSASKISWTAGTAAITDGKVSVSSAGVYSLTASTGTLTKTVYVVAKKETDTEYVLYSKDFSQVTSLESLTDEGYYVAETGSGHTISVTGGKLKLEGAANANTSRINLPAWLADFGDYTVETNLSLTARQQAGRYWSLMTRIQNNDYPYTVFTVRDNSATHASGIEINHKTASNNWAATNKALSGKYKENIYPNGEYSYKYDSYGTHINAYIGSDLVFDADYAYDYATGGIGFLTRGATVEISNVKVTVDVDRVKELYDNVIRDANPAILANAGDTIDLTGYSVTYKSGGAMCAEHLSWTSTDLTVTDGKVTPAAAGVYKVVATPNNKCIEGMGTTVYIVVKNKADKEYVLYDIDYSDYTSLTELTDAGFTVTEQPEGFDIKVEDGALNILGASTNTQSTNARVLLPTWLGEFGNYSISVDAKITNAPNTARYMTITYRGKNDKAYLPSYVASFRADTTATNGHDINLRYYTGSGSLTWYNAAPSMGHSKRLDDGDIHTLTVKTYNNNVTTAFDGKNLINTDFIGVPNAKYNYQSGNVGYLVRGVDAKIYSTRIVLLTEEADLPMANTDAVDSDVILPASVITAINEKADLDALASYTTKPATAILYVDSALKVKSADGNEIASLDTALATLGNKVIPAFYVKDEATAIAVAGYAKANGVYDAFVISDSAAAVKKARDGYSMLRGVLDFSGKTLTDADLYAVRKQTNESGSRVCILPKNLISKKNVEFLQRLFMAVWVVSDDTNVGVVSSIISGASGIITQDVNKLNLALKDYFEAKTMTRTVGIVGHQGVYTLAQPNTVAGSLLAYELGATAIENDVHLTKDGVIVAMHDDTLDRATNGTGKIVDYTYEELKAFEVDQHGGADHQPISTLEDYFKAFKGLDAQLIIEIKCADTAICQKIADLAYEYNIADQVNIIAFSIVQAKEMKKVMPEISVGYLCTSITANEVNPEITVYNVLDYLQTLDSNTYNPSYSVGPLGPETLRAALDRGINIHAYTIDSTENIGKYFGYGTHSITTNYTQYITNTVKELSTDKREYFTTKNTIDITVSAKTYGRQSTPVTDAKLVFVDGNDVFTYANGKITASAEGSATMFMSYTATGVDGSDYRVVTEPFTVTYSTTDPKVALKELQDEKSDIANSADYCPTLWAAFDAAMKLDADAISNDDALKAVADIKALGAHSFTTKASNSQATPADCDNAATFYVQCDNCTAIHDTMTVAVGNKNGHSFTNKASTTQATPADCDNAATFYVQCDNCTAIHDTMTVAVGTKNDHSFTTKDSGQKADDATCKQKQKNYVQCDNCDAVSTDKTIDIGTVADHKYENYVSNNDATCQKNCTETGKCIWCEAPDTREIADTKVDHKFETYVSDNNATCCNDGTKTAECKWCDEKDTVTDKGTAKGHGDTSEVFNDVSAGKWYVDAINYNYTHNFVSGMSKTEFGVSTQITRGQFITILARMAGVDTSNNKVSTKFTDVESGKYYTAAIKWASENGVVNGMSATTFAPNAPIQRQQLCVMIVNFAKYMKIELKAAESAISFKDATAIGNYAKDAVKICQMADIVNGYANGTGFDFKPTNTATRAEAAQILYKFHKDFVAK